MLMERAGIMAMIPHQGQSCLLDSLLMWDESQIICAADNHLDPAHPLHHAGRLHTVCGAEYGMQAAALHGALQAGTGRSRGGLLMSIRGMSWRTQRLDDPAHGSLRIESVVEGRGSAGHSYAFRLLSQTGDCLVEGRAAVVLQ
jgi:predicted hotdog family 3-hydroxylacyl-ACP dehydratase